MLNIWIGLVFVLAIIELFRSETIWFYIGAVIGDAIFVGIIMIVLKTLYYYIAQ